VPCGRSDLSARKTLLLAQLPITFIIAASMSDIMLMIALGLTAEGRRARQHRFIVAWPIAFVHSLLCPVHDVQSYSGVAAAVKRGVVRFSSGR
jgi:hypothetical protein